MKSRHETIVRQTLSLCPQCYRQIKADIVEAEGAIHMNKTCPVHGSQDCLISKQPAYYKELTEYYFRVMPSKMVQKRFYIYLSNKCNLNCPICLLEPNKDKAPDISLESMRAVLKKNKSARFYLYGAEPTLRPDIADWIKLLKQQGNMVNMHTNGLKLDDEKFLSHLKDCGLDYVSVQFDGFNDDIYLKLRGRKLLENKLKVLDNLKKQNIPTGLNVTIAKGVNESEMKPVIDYAVRNRFIRDVSFATLSHLGDAQKHFPQDDLMMPDTLIDMVEEQTAGKISRKNVYLFQKFYYAVLSILKVRRCYNFQHLALVREKGDYITFDDLFDLDKLEKHLDGYARQIKQNQFGASIGFLFRLGLSMLTDGFARKMKCLPLNMLLPGQVRSPRIPDRILLVSFGTVCDAYKYDSQISQYCGQGFAYQANGEVLLTDNISELTLGQETSLRK